MVQPNQEKVEKVSIAEHFLLNAQVGIPLDGKIQLNKDREAVHSYFINEVNRKTVFFTTLEEKINYLLEEKYLDPKVISIYTIDEIKEVYKKAHSYKHRFSSFMSAHKFYKQYALKTWDGRGYLGRYEDTMVWCALGFGNGNVSLALDQVEELMLGRSVPATPTLLNIARVNAGEKTSCFLLSFQDNMNSIRRTKADGEALSALGGGVSFSLINLRESGAPVKGFEGRATSKVLIGKVLEDIASYANQGGARDGAFAIYSHAMHPDVFKVLSVKKENADEKIRMKTMSIGVVIPNIYYELLERGEMMYQFSVYDIERELGIPFSKVDFTKEYYNLVNNDKITKYKIDPSDLEEEMEKLAQESGYPFRLNVDIANDANPIEGLIDMSNICTEILQSSIPQIINKNLSLADNKGQDIACNLSSPIVRGKMLSGKDFGKSVELNVRALTYVSDDLNVPEAPTIQQGNDANHAIGLGTMGLHSYFAEHGIMYGSAESIDFTNIYFMTLRYYALRASNKIARERNRTFDSFAQSEYADGTYFDKYLAKFTCDIQTEKVRELFKDIDIPTLEDWHNLKDAIIEDGLFNSYLLAVAP